MKTTVKITAVTAVILTLIALILDAQGMMRAVITAIELCLYTVIPALFGFLLISAFLLKSGLHRLLFKPLYVIFRRVLRLNEEQFGIFVLSLFGGYPVGAKLIAENQDNKNILPFCFCPSPGFVVAVAGVGLYGEPRVGLAIYLSNVIACLVIALIISRSNKRLIPKDGQSSPLQLSSYVFTSSILSASSALLPVCAVITAFGLIGGVLRFYGIDNAYTLALLEITNVSGLMPRSSLLPFIAALFSFGGLCIIMQIPALTKGSVPLKPFLLWRIPAAIISALVCRLFMAAGFITYESSVPALAKDGAEGISLVSGSPIASAALFMMAVLLVQVAQERTGD